MFRGRSSIATWLLSVSLCFAEGTSGSNTQLVRPKIDTKNAPPISQFYPAESLKKNEQGNVYFSILVDENGLPAEGYLIIKSGHDLLDNAATLFVSQLKFIPGEINGRKTAMWYFPRITFRVNKNQNAPEFFPSESQQSAVDALKIRTEAYYASLTENSSDSSNTNNDSIGSDSTKD